MGILGHFYFIPSVGKKSVAAKPFRYNYRYSYLHLATGVYVPQFRYHRTLQSHTSFHVCHHSFISAILHSNSVNQTTKTFRYLSLILRYINHCHHLGFRGSDKPNYTDATPKPTMCSLQVTPDGHLIVSVRETPSSQRVTMLCLFTMLAS